jgi:hypothetical protein
MTANDGIQAHLAPAHAAALVMQSVHGQQDLSAAFALFIVDRACLAFTDAEQFSGCRLCGLCGCTGQWRDSCPLYQPRIGWNEINLDFMRVLRVRGLAGCPSRCCALPAGQWLGLGAACAVDDARLSSSAASGNATWQKDLLSTVVVLGSSRDEHVQHAGCAYSISMPAAGDTGMVPVGSCSAIANGLHFHKCTPHGERGNSIFHRLFFHTLSTAKKPAERRPASIAVPPTKPRISYRKKRGSARTARRYNGVNRYNYGFAIAFTVCHAPGSSSLS